MAVLHLFENLSAKSLLLLKTPMKHEDPRVKDTLAQHGSGHLYIDYGHGLPYQNNNFRKSTTNWGKLWQTPTISGNPLPNPSQLMRDLIGPAHLLLSQLLQREP